MMDSWTWADTSTNGNSPCETHQGKLAFVGGVDERIRHRVKCPSAQLDDQHRRMRIVDGVNVLTLPLRSVTDTQSRR